MSGHEFDPAKDAVNIAKHGVGLAFGLRVVSAPGVFSVPTIREGDDEERFKGIGLVDGRLFTVVHVWRDGVIRFISVRRSNRGEQRLYYRS